MLSVPGLGLVAASPLVSTGLPFWQAFPAWLLSTTMVRAAVIQVTTTGLAISADIAGAYGGSIRLGTSKAAGLQAELQFPKDAT